MKRTPVVSHPRFIPAGRWMCLAMFSCWALLLQSPAVAGETDAGAKLDTDAQLMGWWKFDGASGTVAADSSKHKHPGELVGGMTCEKNSVAGRIGKALRWDGGDQAVRISGYQGVTGTAPRTIVAWIKTKSPGGEIVSWGKDDFGQMWKLQFIRKHLGVTPNGGYYYMAASVHDDAWHHVAVVVGEADLPNLYDDVTLYLDGKVAEIDRIGLLDLWPVDTGADLEVSIGKKFRGCIDDLRIYARALSEEEIQTLHRQAK